MKSRTRFKAFAPPILDLTPPASATATPIPARPAAPAAPDLFVQAVDLPVAALKDARAAVALQLDRMSPLPPGEGVAAVALIGPAEANLTRYAVAIAPLAIFTPVPGGRPLRRVWVDGALDGETYRFRFDHPETAGERAEGVRGHLQVVAVSALCLILILGGASIGLDQRLADDQDQLARTQAGVAAARRQAQAQSSAARRWAQLGETNQASRVGCVFDRLGSGQGRAYLSALSITPSLITVDYSSTPGPERLTALATQGLAPSVTPPGPVAALPVAPPAPVAPAYGVPGSFQAAPGYPRRGPPPPRSAPGAGRFIPGAFYGPTSGAGATFVPPTEPAGPIELASPMAPIPETVTLTLARWACP